MISVTNCEMSHEATIDNKTSVKTRLRN